MLVVALALGLGLGLGVAAPGVAAAQGGPVAQPTPSADVAARARDLFKKGRQEFDQGHMGAAYESYLAAWELQKSYDIAGNLASLEMETARYRGAAEHAAYALANLPTSSTDAQRGFLDKVLKDAKKQIVTVTIRVNVERAAVTVDGHVVGESPLKGEVYVDAGDHVIAATAPDRLPAQDKLHAEKGTASLIMLTLALPGGGVGGIGAAGGGGGASPLSAITSPRPLVVAGFITAGVALAAGGGLAILSNVKSDDASLKSTAVAKAHPGAPGFCHANKARQECADLHAAWAGRTTFANASFWTFVGAGVVAGGTLAYGLLSPRAGVAPPGAPRAATFRAVPVVLPEGGALLVTGTF